MGIILPVGCKVVSLTHSHAIAVSANVPFSYFPRQFGKSFFFREPFYEFNRPEEISKQAGEAPVQKLTCGESSLGTGLTFEEYVKIKLTPAKEVKLPRHLLDRDYEAEFFPTNSSKTAGHLRSRGYDSLSPMMKMLVLNGVVKVPEPDGWTKADVDAAAQHFEECGLFTPYAAMCQTLGCRYYDFVKPLREAAERKTKKYVVAIPADGQYFIMHRVPPRGGESIDREWDGDSPSIISFTLCDDIRERIERGEVV